MAKNYQSERTLQMKRSFMKLHEKGLGVREIAEQFNLSLYTVYSALGEIAQAAGVTRESLLQRPHGPHLGYERDGYRTFAQVNLDDYEQYTQEVLANFELTISSVNDYIHTQEAIQSKEAEKC